MKKKLSTILIIFTVLAVLLLAFTACEKPNLEENPGADDTNKEETITRTQTITNGTFYNSANATGSTSYLKETVTGWTATAGSLATSATGLKTGAVDLSDSEGLAKSGTDLGLNTGLKVDPKTPYDEINVSELQDNYALLMYYASQETVKKGSLYYKSSSSYSLAKGKKYKLVFSVLTLLDGEAEDTNLGAWVEVRGDIYARYDAIQTGGAWKQYVLYIEGNETQSLSIDLRLWLGYGPANIGGTDNVNPYLVSGAALFDNVICTEISDEDYNAGVATVDKVNVKNYSAKYLKDANFVNVSEITSLYTSTTTSYTQYFDSFRPYTYSTSTSSTTSTAKDYTLILGGDDVTEDPAVTNGFTGIVDLSKLFKADGNFAFKNISAWDKFVLPSTYDDRAKLLRDGLDEYKALMLYYDDFGGAKFTAKTALTIDKGAYYEISVWAYVWDLGADKYPVYSGTEPIKITVPGCSYTKDHTSSADDILARINLNYTGLGSTDATEINTAEVALLGTDKTGNTDGDLKAAKDAYDAAKVESDAAPEDTAKAATTAEKKKEYELLNDVKLSWEAYSKAKDSYDDAKAEFDAKYVNWKNGTVKPNATLKLTGAGDLTDINTDVLGEWKEYTFYVKGNALSSRTLTLELCFGEGEKDAYSTLMMGGALFDNVTVTKVASPVNPAQYSELEPFTSEDILNDNVDIAGLDENASVLGTENKLPVGRKDDLGDPAFSPNWYVNLDTDVLESDFDKIDAAIVNTDYFTDVKPIDERINVNVDGNQYVYNLLMIDHKDYTASVTRLNKQITINPNSYYRLAMWVKTEGIAKDKGVNISLLYSDDKTKDMDEWSVATSITAINSEEWAEIAFYLTGDGLEQGYASIYIEFGDGTRFDTDDYLKGKVYFTAMTMQKIEDVSTKTGTKTGAYTFKSKASTTPTASVTNGNFSTVDIATTTKNDKNAVDANGNLVGLGTTSSWTAETTISDSILNKVGTLKIEAPDAARTAHFPGNYILYWESVLDLETKAPAGYEIYMKNFKDAGKTETITSRLVGYVSADGAEKYGIATDGEVEIVDAGKFSYKYYVKIPTTKTCDFVVKAVSQKSLAAESSEIANTADKDKDASLADNGDVAEIAKNIYKEKKVEFGTLNVKTHEDALGVKDLTELFASAYAKPYVSPYQTVMTIESNYDVCKTIKSASVSLSAGSYYLISVWVKTIGNAKASVTLDSGSTSLTLYTTDSSEYIGYVDQTTGGEWREYRFYIQSHSTNTTSVYLNLSLGNPNSDYYYTNGIVNSTGTDKTKRYHGLSSGTVYFDNVKVINLETNTAFSLLNKTSSDDETKAKAKALYEEGIGRTSTYTDPVSGEKSQVSNEYLTTREGKNDGSKDDQSFNYPVYELNYDNTYAFKNLVLTVDSFDSFTENTYIEEDEKQDIADGKHWLLGHTGSTYTHAKATDGVANITEDEDDKIDEEINLLYGIYSYKNLNQIKHLWRNKDDAKAMDFLSDDFDISEFIRIDGTYSLVMSNLVENGQRYDGGSLTIAAESYYKLTFKAKAAVAEGNYALVRLKYKDSSKDKVLPLKVTSSDTKDYTFYIYNESTTSETVSITFMLGGYETYDEDGAEKNETVKIQGLFVIDSIALQSIDEDAYTQGIKASEAIAEADRENTLVNFHKFAKDATDDNKEDGETDDNGEEEEEENTIFDRGEIWLLVSSIVIGVIIIITVIILGVKKWRKKHPKKVKGENNVKTVKKIEVVETPNTGKKEDIVDNEEYMDVPTVKTVKDGTVKYSPRVVGKKKKKK